MSDALLNEAAAILDDGSILNPTQAPEPNAPPANVKLDAQGNPLGESQPKPEKVSGPKPTVQEVEEEVEKEVEEVEEKETVEEPQPEPQESEAWVQVKGLRRKLIDTQKQVSALQQQVKEKADQVPEVNMEDIKADPLAYLKEIGALGLLADQLQGKAPSGQPKPKAPPPAQLPKEVADRLERIEQAQLNNFRNNVRTTYGSQLEQEEFKLLATKTGAVDEMLEFAEGYVQAAPFGIDPATGIPYTPEGNLLTPQWVARHVQDTFRQEIQGYAQHDAVRELLGAPKPAEENPTAPQAPAKPKKVKKRKGQVAAAPPNDEVELTPMQELQNAVALIPEDAWGEE